MKFFDKYVNTDTHTNTTAGTFDNKISAIEKKWSGASSVEFVQKIEKMFYPKTNTTTNAKE